ncbi:MAG TPA: sensor domain-containing diguanylate cyclase [Candidatus Acidoferrales bacterium]|nr:sensor domain-containing diguanylate cyclase [Candidatus Acidoferrales bacterium]
MRTPRTPFLATRPASPRDYLGAGSVFFVVLVIAAAIAPYAPTQTGIRDDVVGFCQVASIAFQLTTALLLYGQWRAGRHPSTGFLAIAFAYSAILTLLFVIEYPNLVTTGGIIPVVPSTVGYFAFAWQLGTYALLGVYAATTQRLRPFDSGVRITAGVAGAFAIGLLLLVITRGAALPPLSEGSRFTDINQFVLHPITLLIGIATLVSIVAATRLKRSIDVYAALFVAGLVADAYLLQVGSERYSFGRIGARLEVLIVSATVAFVLIRHVNLLYRQLTTENRRLARAAMVDPLTGVANRRAFDVHIEGLEGNAVLLIIDIDHFKNYNDLEGHRAGDDCIRRVARALAANVLRSEDLIARYGGDEFAAILHDIDLDDAIHVAERIRRAVVDLGIPAQEDGATITVSIGVAAFLPGEETSDLVRRADEALYRAKSDGRNRVAFDEETVFEPL